VGQPITVGGANATDPTHTTTISGYTNNTTVTLATAAPAAVTNKRVSWGLRAYLDTRTLLDDEPAVDKVSKVTTPTFLINGFLDGAVDVGNRMAIEAWKKLPAANTGRYLYLGACGHGTPACNATNSANLRSYIHRFLDRHLRGDGSVVPATGGCTTTCVFYTVPPKHVFNGTTWEIPHTSAWATPSESSAWPPATSTPVTFYLRNTAGQPGLDETPPGVWSEPDETINNSRMGSPIIPFCLGLTYEPSLDEVEVYDSDAFGLDPNGNPWKLADFEVNLVMKSSTTRLQVYADLYELKSDGREVRIWAQQAVKPAHARAVAPNTKVTMRFRPGDAAMSIASGSKLRLKVATNYKGYFAQEPYNSTFTIVHDSPSTTPSWFKATFL
jgi:predicted acyl esterase